MLKMWGPGLTNYQINGFGTWICYVLHKNGIVIQLMNCPLFNWLQDMCDDAKEEADLHEIVTAGLFIVLLLRLWMHLLIITTSTQFQNEKKKI